MYENKNNLIFFYLEYRMYYIAYLRLIRFCLMTSLLNIQNTKFIITFHELGILR